MSNRFKEILAVMNITIVRFAANVGVSEGSIRDIIMMRVTSISPQILDYLASYGINLDWLITGRGEMFLKEKSNTTATTTIHNSTIGVYKNSEINHNQHFLLDDDESALITSIRKSKKGKAKLIEAIRNLLKLSLIFLTVYKTIEWVLI